MSAREKLEKRILMEMVMGEDEAFAREIWRELPSELKIKKNLDIILQKIKKYKKGEGLNG